MGKLIKAIRDQVTGYPGGERRVVSGGKHKRGLSYADNVMLCSIQRRILHLRILCLSMLNI